MRPIDAAIMDMREQRAVVREHLVQEGPDAAAALARLAGVRLSRMMSILRSLERNGRARQDGPRGPWIALSTQGEDLVPEADCT